MEFWFDFASTYSYPAAARIEREAQSRGITLQWKAFLLGPIFREQGWSDSPFNLFADQGRYMWRDLERVCHAAELPYQRPSQFPRNGLLAARVACGFQEADWVPAFVRAVFRANFEQDLDIADAAVVGACLDGLGLDGDSVLAEAQTPVAKARLADQTAQARAQHLFGAPSFVVAGELFWGNDRLLQALAAAEMARDRGAEPPAT